MWRRAGRVASSTAVSSTSRRGRCEVASRFTGSRQLLGGAHCSDAFLGAAAALSSASARSFTSSAAPAAANSPSAAGSTTLPVSHPDMIREICHNEVPGWHVLPTEAFSIKTLTGGMSNLNFKVSLQQVPGAQIDNQIQTVMFRVYGKEASLLYDSELEFNIASMLAKYYIAPQLYAHGKDWRIEEWHDGIVLPTWKMRNTSILVQVAAHLGRLHKLCMRPDFPADIRSSPVNSRTRLNLWGDACRTAADAFTEPENKKKLPMIAEILAEREWILPWLGEDDPKIKGSGMDVVFSFWDSQENNIMQTMYGLRFIDWEYAGMEHQAYDIANYFIECTVDYHSNTYPFYKVCLADYPTDTEQRIFCSVYLSEYLGMIVRPGDLSVTVLIERVRRFVLMNHLMWSMWSVIKAPQVAPSDEFDYLHYGQYRWFMYKWAKRDIFHGKRQRTGSWNAP
eukprot:TRINITY_DN56514_c0_g1_i1.p1 TRINITY_DN56514_c0_g1~~TRINITY_DN56514_c0_g1_i1.p1  ORF type:complete len:452 (-),score=70.41 TRINITY_DN56514_c0_g1_i1:271-1626(-)